MSDTEIETSESAVGKRKNADLTEGSLWDKIVFFALPIVLMNILQQLFNTADIAVVGRLVGNDALAAVGSAGPIVTLFITIFSGLSVGANAVIARMVGSGNQELNMMIEVISGALRGWGHSFLPAMLSLFFVCGVRMIWLFVIFPMDRTYEWLMSVYPVSWVLAVASLAGAYFYVKRKLFMTMPQGN